MADEFILFSLDDMATEGVVMKRAMASTATTLIKFSKNIQASEPECLILVKLLINSICP